MWFLMHVAHELVESVPDSTVMPVSRYGLCIKLVSAMGRVVAPGLLRS